MSWLLALLACSPTALRAGVGAGDPGTSPPSPLPEEGSPTGGAEEPGTTPAPGTSGPGTPTTATPAEVPDCAAIDADPDHEVCAEGPGFCEATFDDGAGCVLTCAAAGLGCEDAWDNVDGACLADANAVGCDWTGHTSDYCRCAGPVVAPVEDCNTYPYRPDTLLFDRVGFGAAATGGDPDQLFFVTTLAADGPGSLREALESEEPWWVVFDVEGTITFEDRIHVRSDKTVDGRGRDITLNGNLQLEHVSNVILTDLAMTNDTTDRCGQDGDVITVRGTSCDDPSTCTSHDLWFHHLELYDGGDGVLDLRGATAVTLSWTHIHDHKKAMLHGLDWDDLPASGMQVTYHHNFFDRVSLRGPQFIYGQAHFFNNVQYEWYEYGAGSLDGAEMVSERNVYQARPGSVCVLPCDDPAPCGDSDFVVSKEALVVDWGGHPLGKAISVGDLLLEGAVVHERETSQVFDPADHYSWVAETATTALRDAVMADAGPRDAYCP